MQYLNQMLLVARLDLGGKNSMIIFGSWTVDILSVSSKAEHPHHACVYFY